MRNLTVVPFVIDTKASSRLTQQDKIDAWVWEQTAFRTGYNQAVVQAHEWVQGVEQDEFVLVYRLGSPWAQWGAARQGHGVMVWRCSDGVEVGSYLCMKTALGNLPQASTGYTTSGQTALING